MIVTMTELIFILGDGRSGSTILNIILSNQDEILGPGELYKWIEFKGLPNPRNEDNSQHEFWYHVHNQYLERSQYIDFILLQNARQEIENYWKFIRVFLGLSNPVLSKMYQDASADLINSLKAVSGKPIVVDASRNMGRALELYRKFGTKMKIIHLVRDPRGIVWSYQKKQIEQDYKHPLISSFHNLIKNIFCTLLEWRIPNETFYRIKYEDLMLRPVQELNQLAEFLDLSLQQIIDKIKKDDPLIVPNILDGNRVRKRTRIKLKIDTEWKESLPKLERLLSVIITFPFFVKYGYYKKEY